MNKTFFIKNKMAVTAGATVLLAGVLFAFFIFSNRNGGQALLPTISVTIGDVALVVEKAETEASRQVGLSGRRSLFDGTGMLFFFDRDDRHGIWMKDMLFPIDILWFDSENTLVYFVRDAVPESYPGRFFPHTAARFVLEVPAGFVDQYGIEVGDVLQFE